MSNSDDRAAAPIFVIGSPRSGTSILTWCLGQHPNILPSEESDWMGPFALQVAAHHAIGSARGERSQLSAFGIRKAEFMRAFGERIDRLILDHRHRLKRNSDITASKNPEQIVEGFAVSRDDDEPKQRWVDGTPEYSLHVEGLIRLFPRAKFIHIVRDVDQVVASMLNFQAEDGSRLVHDEEQAYDLWWRYARASALAEQALGGERVYRLRYEDLVERSGDALRDVLAFLDEPFSTACAEPLATRINSSSADDGAAHEPVDAQSPVINEAQRLSARLKQNDGPASVSDVARRSQTEDFEKRAEFLRDLPNRYDKACEALAALRAEGSLPLDGASSQRSAVQRHGMVYVLRRRLNWCGALFVFQCVLAVIVMLSNLDMSTLKGEIDVLWSIVSLLLLLAYLWMRRVGVVHALARLRDRVSAANS